MRWLRCLNPQSELFVEAQNAVQEKGCWEIHQAVFEAMVQDTHTLTPELIARWASVKIDRAKRLLPFAQKILRETRKISGKSVKNLEESDQNPAKILENPPEIYPKSDENLLKSSENIEEISQESNENLSDFDTSNPHGSNNIFNNITDKVTEEKELILKEESLSHTDREREEFFKKFGETGQAYLFGLEDGKFKDNTWVAQYLDDALPGLIATHPQFPVEDFLKVWKGVCNAAVKSNPQTAKWFETTFADHLTKHKSAPKPKPVQTEPTKHWEVLINSEWIQNISDANDIRCGFDYAYRVIRYPGDKGQQVSGYKLVNREDEKDFISPENYQPMRDSA